MTPELWQRVALAFDQDKQLEHDGRATFLRQLREQDAAVHDEVASLLRQHGDGQDLTSLPTPLWQQLVGCAPANGASPVRDQTTSRGGARYAYIHKHAQGGM